MKLYGMSYVVLPIITWSCERSGIDRDALLPISPHDYGKVFLFLHSFNPAMLKLTKLCLFSQAIRLLREKAGLPQAWRWVVIFQRYQHLSIFFFPFGRRELMQMLHVRRKAEIEIFSSANVSNATTNHDSQNSVTNGDDSHLQAGSLLVQYLLRKINSACHSEFLVAEPHWGFLVCPFLVYEISGFKIKITVDQNNQLLSLHRE